MKKILIDKMEEKITLSPPVEPSVCLEYTKIITDRLDTTPRDELINAIQRLSNYVAGTLVTNEDPASVLMAGAAVIKKALNMAERLTEDEIPEVH